MSPEFAPQGKLVSAQAALEFDYHQDQQLAKQLREAAYDLEMSPRAAATQHDVKIGPAPILDAAGKHHPGNSINLEYSETKENHNATIRIQEAGVGAAIMQLSPINPDLWDVRHTDSGKTVNLFSTGDLVGYLSARLPNKLAYADMLKDSERNRQLDGMLAVHLLADYIKGSARTIEDYLFYEARIQDRTVGLMREETKIPRTHITSHKLSVDALTRVGNAKVLKLYTYTSAGKVERDKKGRLKPIQPPAGTGTVQMSSMHGVPGNKLQEWANEDQEDHYPTETLHTALSALRHHYHI